MEVPPPGEVKEEVAVAVAAVELTCVASGHFRLRRPRFLLPSHVSARGRQRKGLAQQRGLPRWPVLAMPLLGRIVTGKTCLKTVREAVVLEVAEGSSRIS